MEFQKIANESVQNFLEKDENLTLTLGSKDIISKIKV